METPIDPDIEALADSIEGVATVAKLMGELFRRLLDEGFKRKEALELCEAWMLQTFDEME